MSLIYHQFVDSNVGTDRLPRPKALTTQLLEITNPLITRLLAESPNCA